MNHGQLGFGSVFATRTPNELFRLKLGQMKLHPRVTKAAVELVERFEGLRRRAARLPDGGWTIGYGHTLSAREGAVVSAEDAEALLYYDMSEVATKVEAWTFTPLNQNQFEALTAFAFNIGVENFRRSTVLKRVNEGQHLQAAAAMELWRKTEVDGEGLVVDALVRRRAAEKAHYLTPPEGFRPSPTQVLKPAFDFSVIEAAAHSQFVHRTAIVDAPLDGDVAVAMVEAAPAKSEVPVEALSPVREAGAQATERLQALLPEDDHGTHALVEEAVAAPILAAAVFTPALHAREPVTKTAIEPATHEPVNDVASPEASPFPVSTPSFAFRSFEPPPSRFGRPVDQPPAPANEHQPELETVSPLPAVEPAAELEAEPQSEFNLFDRPLAPPASPATEAAPIRTLRLRDDAEATEGAEAIIANAKHHSPILSGPIGAVLANRTVVWGAVGCAGVLFFTLAITSMMLGRPTIAHLAIGLLGALLITLAGVYFLLRRTGGESAPATAPVEAHIPDAPEI